MPSFGSGKKDWWENQVWLKQFSLKKLENRLSFNKFLNSFIVGDFIRSTVPKQ